MMIVKLSLMLFAAGLFIMPISVNAVSCKCWADYGTTAREELEAFPPGVVCGIGVSLQDCAPGKNNIPTEVYTDPNNRLLKGLVSCQPYRDDNCQKPAGVVDPNSVFSPCWSKDKCEEAGGDWDEKNKNQKPCSKYGSVDTARCFVKPPDMPLQIGIPGVTDKFCSIADKDGKFKSCTDLGASCGEYGVCRPGIKGGFPGYLAAFYKFFIAALAVCAIVMVMWGGFKRIMAAGSPELIRSANETIIGAITGVVIALLSYSLLNLVNPKLVENTGIVLDKVKTDFFKNSNCPETDPLTGNYIQCGEKTSVAGMACIGMSCLSGGSCYKIGTSGVVETRGVSKIDTDYKCVNKGKELCESMTYDQATKNFGVNIENDHVWLKEDFFKMNYFCSQFSLPGTDSNSGICVAKGGGETIKDSRCIWTPWTKVEKFCTMFPTCDDMNKAYKKVCVANSTRVCQTDADCGGTDKCLDEPILNGQLAGLCAKDVCHKGCESTGNITVLGNNWCYQRSN